MRISDGELKQLLVSSGAVKAAALEEATALKPGESTKDSLLNVVLKKKLVTEKELFKLYAKSIDVPFVELDDIKIPHETLTKIPERIARKYQAVLFGIKDNQLQLAMADPEDFQAADFITKQIGSTVKRYLALPADIASALDQYKGSITGEISKAIKDSSNAADADAEDEKVSAKDLAEDAPIAKTVNVIVEYALKSRASDIHIEPREAIVQVRYRVDGVLKEAMTLPRSILAAVISRIKILSNLKIDEHRLPQDGRFKFTVGAKTIALRVSTLPIMDGEKVVMRLLDEGSRALTLEELGFDGEALARITRGIHKPHGMVLVTGPTGSGKSTTLYSVLSLLNSPMVNISTIEDPVEYRVAGVNQTQVNPKAGMTFAAGLRALLRQDPNVIMVGEIRDGETADLAVQAALTGHVVLSTLHTNNAATTLPRLLDMGIEPFLIASTVNTVIGQRLVRRLCPSCRVPYVPQGQQLQDLKKDFDVEATLKLFRKAPERAATATPVPEPEPLPAAIASEVPEEPHKGKGRLKVIQPTRPIEADKTILDKIAADPNIINRSAVEASAKHKDEEPEAKPEAAPVVPKVDPDKLKDGQFVLYSPGPGCDQCGHNGYFGRLGIYEVLEVDETLIKMIVARADAEEIQQAAIRAGMLTMQQDGLLKSLQGHTSVEEVLRVTRE